jgi:hypothetical protein
MARTKASPESPEQNNNPAVSLMAGLADVPQPGPTKEIIIGDVPAKPKREPAPAAVAEYGDDGSITIK